jgi:hypothetical protein
MTYSYVSATDVQAELRATESFADYTYPSLSTVNTWIEQESNEVNTVSGRIWGTTDYSETIDYQGEDIITLKNAPLVSVTSVIYSTGPLGTDSYSLSDTKVEDTDYTVYTDEGEIVPLPNWRPQDGRKRIQINYNAGYATIPPTVQKLVTKKVARRTIDSLLSKDINEKQSGKSVSVGSISIVKPADFGVKQYTQLKQDIDELEQKLLNGTTAYRIGGHRY